MGNDHIGGDRVHRRDADRVLSSDRGDRRHPVHAGGRKCLEIGLDAGAAAGVGAGDGEDARCALRFDAR